MIKTRIYALIIILIAGALGYFSYTSETLKTGPFANFPFKLGLDLNGGTHLVYKADTSSVKSGDISGAMDSLRDVIEKRVNLFGVSEPIVQVEKGGVPGGKTEDRLIVELPGVTNIGQAVQMIGQTPLLEFRLMAQGASNLSEEELQKKTVNDIFIPTELTGRYLERANLEFDQNTRQPKVGLVFDSEGSRLFAKITKENIGRVLAIFLDGVPISNPVIRQEIIGGKAEISGNFTPEEAKKLVQDLNYGALPVPIELIQTQTIGASLGEEAKSAGINAGIYAFVLISIFLVIWYRLPGVISVLALCVYTILNLVLFKLIPVTLTSAGIAGFILSIGMAVDANILIFERMKEELNKGKALPDAIKEGFSRAWLSIRDSNLSSIITAVILFWFASTSIVKGFALVFGIGVLTSMFTAITVSRTLLVSLGVKGGSRLSYFLFGSGFFGNKIPSNNLKNNI